MDKGIDGRPGARREGGRAVTDVGPGRLGPHVIYGRHGAIAVVTLDCRGTLNALVDDDLTALERAVVAAGHDDAVRALVVTGAGDDFSVGGDVEKMDQLLESGAVAVRKLLEEWQRPLVALERLEKPTVAAVNGVCMSAGASIALACDIRVVSTRARIAFPSVKAGLVTDLGCTARLPDIVGQGWARHFLLTGCVIDAATARQSGLATVVLDGDSFLDDALRFVETELLPQSLSAQCVMKRLLLATRGGRLSTALEIECASQAVLYGGADAREGRAAIRDRRAPDFHGRDGKGA